MVTGFDTILTSPMYVELLSLVMLAMSAMAFILACSKNLFHKLDNPIHRYLLVKARKYRFSMIFLILYLQIVMVTMVVKLIGAFVLSVVFHMLQQLKLM